ncbi:protein of unknown function [Aminobacter niigataensis]|nr:protein of unknown function [Aminobacter niigataensis]
MKIRSALGPDLDLVPDPVKVPEVSVDPDRVPAEAELRLAWAVLGPHLDSARVPHPVGGQVAVLQLVSAQATAAGLACLRLEWAFSVQPFGLLLFGSWMPNWPSPASFLK